MWNNSLPIIVEVGGCYGAAKVWAHLFTTQSLVYHQHVLFFHQQKCRAAGIILGVPGSSCWSEHLSTVAQTFRERLKWRSHLLLWFHHPQRADVGPEWRSTLKKHLQIIWWNEFHCNTKEKVIVHLYKCASCCPCWPKSFFLCCNHHLGSSRTDGRYLKHRETRRVKLLGADSMTTDRLTLPFKASRRSNNDFTLSDGGWNPHGAHCFTSEVTLKTVHKETKVHQE